MTDEQIVKALECCLGNTKCGECPILGTPNCMNKVFGYALDLFKRQRAEILAKTAEYDDMLHQRNKLEEFTEEQQKEISSLEYTLMGVMHSVDKWLDGDELKQDEINRAATMREKTLKLVEVRDKKVIRLKNLMELEIFYNTLTMESFKAAKSKAIKEFAEKITEIFMQYAHLHSYAESARKDFIEAADGAEIEMQSVWDVFTLKKYEMSEYEEMNRLQKNIEIIEKERLLTELENDFRLLVKEMGGDKNV